MLLHLLTNLLILLEFRFKFFLEELINVSIPNAMLNEKIPFKIGSVIENRLIFVTILNYYFMLLLLINH